MSRPFPARRPSVPPVRINGKIRAREVRVIGVDNQQIGVLSLHEAITLARTHAVDLVEIAPNATPPVCRLVDFGKFRYEQSKRDKESKKKQHANRVKEIQLSPGIDPHDYSVKLSHAVDFLCEDMKVKISLRFRGREMAHQEFGFQVVRRFLKDVTPYGHPDAEPKLIGRGINVMLSPLPRNKRARNPNESATGAPAVEVPSGPLIDPLAEPSEDDGSGGPEPEPKRPREAAPAEGASGGFSNNPFSSLNL